MFFLTRATDHGLTSVMQSTGLEYAPDRQHSCISLSVCLSVCLFPSAAESGPVAQVWSVCPIDSSSSLREENAIVCCSMLGGLTASKCLCDEVGHAEPDMLQFITGWQQVCSTETLTKVR